MSWVVWAVVLLLQNASFTLVSRARNSRSLSYHAIASVLSNGIWFLSLGLAVNKLTEAETWGQIAFTAAFYTVFTVIGSVGMHHVLMEYVETGKRKVGF
jgi:O-antigen/teichoic acid export membrane protein